MNVVFRSAWAIVPPRASPFTMLDYTIRCGTIRIVWCDIIASQSTFVNPFSCSFCFFFVQFLPFLGQTVYLFLFFCFCLFRLFHLFLLNTWVSGKEREKMIHRGSTQCIYVLRNVDTVKRVFRVHFNTLSPWALGKFQFCTMAIEPRQNLQFNSCLIFNEVCIYFSFSIYFALGLHFSTCRKLQVFTDMYSKNQFQILFEWSYLSLN